MKRRTQIVVGLLGSCVAVYIVSFAVLATLGGYMLLPSGHTPSVRLSLNDTYVWQPLGAERHLYHNRFTGEDSYQMDRLGFFYAPLFAFVQEFLRPSIPWLRPGETLGSVQVAGRQPPRNQLHPSMVSALEQMRSEFHHSSETMNESR